MIKKERMLENKQKLSLSDKQKLEKIANYWEDKSTISLMDANLKSLEINAIKKFLKKHYSVVDIGCGDGQSACECSKIVRKMLAIDNSQSMINEAKNRAKKKYPNLTIKKMNILELQSFNEKFDAAITDRVITNLPNWKLQKKAILDIKSILKPHGRYIMIENFNEGYDRLNKLRATVGLEKIPKHWHNTYLNKSVLNPFLKNHFRIVEQISFNLYYFLTRAYIPMFGSFTGWGKNAKSDPIFKVSDPAAKKIHENFSSVVHFFDDGFFGPINGLVLIKK